MAVGVIQPTWSAGARANTTMKSRSVIDKQTWRHLVAGWLRTSAGSGSTEAQVAEQCSVFQRTVQRIKAKIRSEELRYPWSGRSWSLRTPGNTAAVSAAHCGAADQVRANQFENSILEFSPMVHTRR